MNHVSLDGIQKYQSESLSHEEKIRKNEENKKKYKSNKNFQNNWFFNFLYPIAVFLFLSFLGVSFVSNFIVNVILLIIIALGTITALIKISKENKELLEKIKSYELVEKSLQKTGFLEGENTIKIDPENRNYVSGTTISTSEDDELELDTIVLSEILEQNIGSLKDACQHFKVNAASWLELAHQIFLKDRDLASRLIEQEWEISYVEFTVDKLKSEFSSFQEAKAHYGLTARGWQDLVDKLNRSK